MADYSGFPLCVSVFRNPDESSSTRPSERGAWAVYLAYITQ